MAMPHIIFKRKCIDRIKGLTGKEKINKINEIITELPKFKSGPYADIEKYLKNEISVTKTRSSVQNKDMFAIKKQGDLQVVFVGMPSVGKSSLVAKLSNKDIKIGSYDFTTVRPDAATINYRGLHLQLVDLPGLIEEASTGKGLGKRVISAMHNADVYVYVCDITKPLSDAKAILLELQKSNINFENKLILAVNKIDLVDKQIDVKSEFNMPNIPVLYVSVNSNTNLEQIKQEIYKKSGFITVTSAKDNSLIPLRKDRCSVKDLCLKIHKDLEEKFKFAQVSGNSVKFNNQKVGINHILDEGDIVEISTNL